RKAWQISDNRTVQVEQPLVLQNGAGQARKYLADRAHIESGVDSGRTLLLDRGQAERFLPHDIIFVQKRNGNRRDVGIAVHTFQYGLAAPGDGLGELTALAAVAAAAGQAGRQQARAGELKNPPS